VLFDRHYDEIWRYVGRRAGAGLADELASEAFLRAFGSRAAYDPRQPDARPWLYGIATRADAAARGPAIVVELTRLRRSDRET
jgi:DNA-directed RNA polymerase specialized sigma24 family protein